jgi:tRNA (cmo5U34)-methyltransferase
VSCLIGSAKVDFAQKLCGVEISDERIFLMRDHVFQSSEPVSDFRFDATVASVFEDMLERSVPFYSEVQRMVVELARSFLDQEGVVYDIGCSTGTTMAAIAGAVDPTRPIRFVGLEPSEAMREKAREKFAATPDANRFEILPHAIETVEELPNARVITLLYTLQFVRPAQRLRVLKMCVRSLQPGGCLIMAEKIISEQMPFRRLFIDLYHDFKRRSGYSAMEISRKREALENVLIPYMGSENLALLREAGFSAAEPIFQWYNFAAYLAVKDGRNLLQT